MNLQAALEAVMRTLLLYGIVAMLILAWATGIVDFQEIGRFLRDLRSSW